MPDVVVIGGGVVGVACARELAQRGAKVTVLERDRIGHGCSYGNAGWLTPSLASPLPNPAMLPKAMQWMFNPESPLYIQPRPGSLIPAMAGRVLDVGAKGQNERGTEALVELCRVSVDLWEEVAKRAPGSFGFERHGLLAVYEKAESFEAARSSVDFVASRGIRAERWTSDEVREREPAVVGKQVGGYFYPDDAHCEPYRAVTTLAAEARAAGVTFVEGAEVFGISGSGSGPRMLKTTRGEVKADRLVVATGPWSEQLGSMLGVRLPVLGAKGYSLLLPRANPHPTRSIYLIERKVAVNPHADALRIAGTLELVRNDFSINARRVDVILRGAKAMLNLGDSPVVRETWRGLRPCTPDGMPLIGRARGGGEVWLATGHQMTGLKTATGTGLLLAQLMSGETPRFDPEPFRADRY
ncbi:MAG: FAD-dependent oxidoreductase [Acidobacteria bacterium]|nr:FAD-dependent oxidoreductase [Acidobacteriota bacterium]